MKRLHNRFLGSAALVLGLCGAACGRSDGDSPPVSQPDKPQTASSNVGSPASAQRVGFAVELTSGDFISFEPYDKGYKVEGPGLAGAKLKVGDDRVKLRRGEQTLAKVKVKEYGFKVYRDDTNESLKVKHKGAGYSVALAGGTKLGKLATGSSELGGQATEVVVNGGSLEVQRGGKLLAKVPQHLGTKAASFMALEELSLAERVAAMVFVVEHQR